MNTTYDELFEQAADEPAFSTSDEGEYWIAHHCGTCVHDAPSRAGDEANGCPLILLALIGRTPAQWTGDPYICSSYCKENPS